MGDEYRTERVQRSQMINEFALEHDNARRHLPPHAYQAPARPQHRSAADIASVLGLPAELVTAELLEALVPVLVELDRLRLLSEQAERRFAWLERQSDRHSVVPCLTRRAFMRELESFLLAGGDAHGTLALVQVAGIEAVRQIYGLAAGDGALRHVCANILGALRASDLVGCLGGSDFAVLLPGTDLAQAGAKLGEITARLADPPYTWLGQRIPLTPGTGLYQLRRGEGAEQALAAADRRRRGLE
ncbi:diguanylate cyclase domain-containing protein [Magnetospirillum sp. UT-4]|uniref:GGDEF domain-containing protein n=1 Tax=Magnetospirillum sp. UT-4 TaxID=2681467 RepID=UPI001571929E|nr:diguanylate cyclase [Magnetospirillum sp. UT-4]